MRLDTLGITFRGECEYTHTDGRTYLCTVEISESGIEITWHGDAPQGDWNDDGWLPVQVAGE